MESPTGVMEIVELAGIRRFEWNGVVEDRAAAMAAFDDALTAGALAVVMDEPRKGHMVRSFAEVEEAERERGTVSVQVTRPLVGG